jgi:hypothetical protein
VGFPTGGAVTLVSITQGGGSGSGLLICPPFSSTFAPPLQLVPATPVTGATWSGVVTAGGFTGSYDGAVTGQATATVGGRAVAVWTLHGSIRLNGTYCGMTITATLTLDSQWAPSLRLPVSGSVGFDATAGLIHVTGTSTTTLLATTPG